MTTTHRFLPQPISVVSLLLVAFFASLIAAAPAAAPNPQPNVVLIMTDDQGYGDIGAHGNTMIRTPNLDRLHSRSIRFTNFHVDPTCSPTRSALMTGRYSTRTGVWHTIMGRSLMFSDEVTMAQVFESAGYRTGIFGKWHLGDNHPMRPQDRGFQESVVIGGGGITQTPDFWGNDYFDDTYSHNGVPEKYTGYCTDVFFDNALRFIAQNRATPFFAYVPTNVPHGPFNVADKYSRPYRDKGVPADMANFYGMIENADENIGRLLAKLREWGLEENTLVIFMTDNGTAAGIARPNAKLTPGSWAGFNAGMRGQKGSQYDGGHRVPLFFHWPAGGLTGGRDIPTLAAHFDLLPTVTELCGLTKPASVQWDGRSLVPLLRNRTVEWPDRSIFTHVQRQEIPPKWTRSAVLTQRWRLVDRGELYDMTSDPGQTRNLAGDHPDVVARLQGDYERWWASLAPALERFAWIDIGSDKENPARITCHDWHSDQVPWNQNMIRNAPFANGYWMIRIERAGRYTFELRQQPEAAAFPLQATRARIEIGTHKTEAAVSSGATVATLTLDLKPGTTKMQTWLIDESSGKSRGAFFVNVHRQE